MLTVKIRDRRPVLPTAIVYFIELEVLNSRLKQLDSRCNNQAFLFAGICTW